MTALIKIINKYNYEICIGFCAYDTLIALGYLFAGRFLMALFAFCVAYNMWQFAQSFYEKRMFSQMVNFYVKYRSSNPTASFVGNTSGAAIVDVCVPVGKVIELMDEACREPQLLTAAQRADLVEFYDYLKDNFINEWRAEIEFDATATEEE